MYTNKKKFFKLKKKKGSAKCRWLTPIILAIQEAEIRRIAVQSQLQAGGVAQGVGPAFKPQYPNKNKRPWW
jgi:hypothetical protein